MNLKEVLDYIHDSMLEKDLFYELTPENQKILARTKGTFEAILSGKGNEKFLIPEAGTLHFLYRGQNKEFNPCVPTIYRGQPSDVEIFIERMRLTVFKRLLNSHPIVRYFFKRHNFVVDSIGLAQHYGLKTEVLDLTSNIDVAMFFATCKYDSVSDSYSCFDDDEIHEGILYVFDPLFDNEPCPPIEFNSYMRGNIRPIGLQAFLRPGMQEGYALHIQRGQSTKSWIYRFTFTSEDSQYYYEKYKKGEALWIKDELIEKVSKIKDQTSFSFSVFNETFEAYRPKGFSKTSLKKAIDKAGLGVSFSTKVEDVVFSKEECHDIVNQWNDGKGEAFCSKILRKPWYNHEGIDESTQRIIGIKNRHDFNTFDHLSEFLLLKMAKSPNGPKHAEWCNYTDTPRPDNGKRSNEVRKIEACCNNVFGKQWLTREDWSIDSSIYR